MTGAAMADERHRFVMSDPAGTFLETDDDEPWHYRCVGRDLAAHAEGGGRTPRETLSELR